MNTMYFKCLEQCLALNRYPVYTYWMSGYIQNEKVHSESEARAIIFWPSRYFLWCRVVADFENTRLRWANDGKQALQSKAVGRMGQLPGCKAQLCPLGAARSGASRCLCPPQPRGLNDSTFLSGFLWGLSKSVGKTHAEKSLALPAKYYICHVY